MCVALIVDRLLKELYRVDKYNVLQRTDWASVHLCLSVPLANYSLRFDGAIGQPYRTIIGFDAVELKMNATLCKGRKDIINITSGKTKFFLS